MINEISDAQKHHFCQELIDLIVDHIPLGHRKTLCRIALTSKSFCISAQRTLFHTITFKEESMPVGEEGLGEYFDYIDHEGSEDIANYFDVSRKFISTRLSGVLSNTPHLAGLVKVVRIYDHTCLKDPSAVDWLMDFEDVDSDYMDFEESDNEEDMLGPWLPHDTSLNHILPLLTNLEPVYLGGFFVDGSPMSVVWTYAGCLLSTLQCSIRRSPSSCFVTFTLNFVT
ncbi:hypothetical protein BT96DRAFT_60361 [Gymnopus androsaceus JB14]|uniref:Uncharacterized protein n=1 Tax=Gymnopus androsaceus JB14 TaxID=1447944 RepID=A0A6A4IG43_9AGAR|nr:hypothetical protein BT96DRAFT_60361 [Gymnopus androsaceus JB14]